MAEHRFSTGDILDPSGARLLGIGSNGQVGVVSADTARQTRLRNIDSVTDCTVTFVDRNIATAIANGVVIQPDDTRWHTDVPVRRGTTGSYLNYVQPCYIDSAAPGVDPVMSGTGMCTYSILTDAQEVDVVYYYGLTINENVHRIWADDDLVMPAQINPYDITGGYYRTHLSFSERKLRLLQIETSRMWFGGIVVGPTDTVLNTEIGGPVVMIVGDSIVWGTGAAHILDGWVPQMFRRLGIHRGVMSAIGGTGYLATSSGTKKNLLQRLETDIFAIAPDILIHCNGVNDQQFMAANEAGVRNNVEQCFAEISNGLPRCRQIAFGPFGPCSRVGYNAVRDLIADCADTAGIQFIDNLSVGEITGTGYSTAPTGVGNSDWVIGSDAVHPTPDGHAMIARCRAQLLRDSIV